MVTRSVNVSAKPTLRDSTTGTILLVLVCQCLFIKTGVLGQARQSEIQLERSTIVLIRASTRVSD